MRTGVTFECCYSGREGALPVLGDGLACKIKCEVDDPGTNAPRRFAFSPHESLNGLLTETVQPRGQLAGRTPRHEGYFEHPQNCPPAFAPFLAVRLTISEPQVGQEAV